MDVKEKVEKVKAKAKETKEKAKEKVKPIGEKVSKLCKEEPWFVLQMALTVGSALIKVGLGAVDNRATLDKCLVEDDVTGCNYLTTHPLTNSEILELSNRMSDGETHGEALNNMGLLRKEKKRK